jgi:hypothetical protein
MFFLAAYRFPELPHSFVVFSASVAFGALAFAYLSGPAATLTVTRDTVIVDNPFFRYVVPRHLVSGASYQENLSIGVELKDGRHVSVSAVQRAGGDMYSMRTTRRKAGEIQTCLDAIPAGPSVGTVERKVRYTSFAVALIPIFVAVISAWQWVAWMTQNQP